MAYGTRGIAQKNFHRINRPCPLSFILQTPYAWLGFVRKKKEKRNERNGKGAEASPVKTQPEDKRERKNVRARGTIGRRRQ